MSGQRANISTVIRLLKASVMAILIVVVATASAGEANAKQAWIVVDSASGQTLKAYRPDHRHYPASLTKLMTLYLVFEALESGRLSPDDTIYTSPHAASMPPSELGLGPGDRLTVETAIKALTTKSANDVAAALAEKLAGTEWDFAMRMTRKARALGMDNTTFRNASGLPNRYQVTTVRDMARLARALIHDFPQYYYFFSIGQMRYHGRVYRNHNNLLSSYSGVDGMKTGYINASGYNLVASAKRNGRRLIAVAVGGRTAAARDRRVAELLDAGFAQAPAPAAPRPRHKPVLRMANAETPEATGLFAIQVGALSAPSPAKRLAKQALQEASGILDGGTASVDRQQSGRRLYRARVTGLSKSDANRACGQLKHSGLDCLVIRRGERQIAHR